MNRIEKLRLRALDDNRFNEEFYYLFYKTYIQLSRLPETERYAEAFYAAFAALTPAISADELIVGNRDLPMQPQAEKEWRQIYKPFAESRVCLVGQDSHMAIDYELLLTKGIHGIMETINGYMADCDSDQLAFYKCCLRCLEAITVHAENYAFAALELSMKTPDPIRAAELKKISEICKKVPAHPAETFYEAVQSVHFMTYCISLNPLRLSWNQFQLGHPDRYLLPYYERDMKNGTLTKDFAQLLLDCLAIQINMRVPNGYSCGYMVGGRDAEGNIVANDLTEMCMQAIEDIRLVYPSVGLCHTEGMPDKYLAKACELLSHGYSHPAIFNDDVITKGLMYYGVPEKEAHSYIHSTCVEITPVAASNAWVATPYTNLVQLLLDSMDQEYTNMEDLQNAVFGRLDTSIKLNFEVANAKRIIRARDSINPLLSCFVNDCLKQGLDIEQGGARYNWTMPSFVGMANLVDSLYAIRQLVFEEKKITLQELKSILEHNFEGHEDLRHYILNKIPKYGNDNDDIDQTYGIITEHIINECEKYSGMYTNGNLIPSVFCWVKHEYFGSQTIASPDGRKAGFPLGDGSGPGQGREMNGPTASILSSTKWDHSKLIGGVAVNLKFAKVSLGPNSLEAMKAIVLTYLKRGGFELQINVVDQETLKKARKNPEEYRDLCVRVGGYSDYFVRLSPQMQEEVILRTAHTV